MVVSPEVQSQRPARMVTKLTRFHGGVLSSLVTRDHLCWSKRSEFVAIVSLCHVPSGHGWKKKRKKFKGDDGKRLKRIPWDHSLLEHQLSIVL